MPLATFDPPVNPTMDTSGDVTPRVKAFPFGDGYSQRAGDGLNAFARRFSLSWSILSNEHFAEIEAFFASLSGSAFIYAIPTEELDRKWRVTGWSAGFIGASDRTLRVNIEEVFDLDDE